MRSKNVFSLLVNPFTRIAGWQALVWGLLFIGLMGIFGTWNGVAFDGVFDMHLFELSFAQSFAYLGLDIIVLALVMAAVGRMFVKHFRFIDILGTMTLAKAPFLLTALFGYFTTAPDMTHILQDPYSIFQSTSFILMMILSLPVMVWSITLMYNALKVSCDLKGSRLTTAFILGLFIAEIIVKILIHCLL